MIKRKVIFILFLATLLFAIWLVSVYSSCMIRQEVTILIYLGKGKWEIVRDSLKNIANNWKGIRWRHQIIQLFNYSSPNKVCCQRQKLLSFQKFRMRPERPSFWHMQIRLMLSDSNIIVDVYIWACLTLNHVILNFHICKKKSKIVDLIKLRSILLSWNSNCAFSKTSEHTFEFTTLIEQYNITFAFFCRAHKRQIIKMANLCHSFRCHRVLTWTTK